MSTLFLLHREGHNADSDLLSQARCPPSHKAVARILSATSAAYADAGPSGGPMIAHILHLIHQARGPSVANTQSTLKQRRRSLPRIQEHIHGLVEKRRLLIGSGFFAFIIFGQSVIIDLFHHRIVILRLFGLSFQEVCNSLYLRVSDQRPLDTDGFGLWWAIGRAYRHSLTVFPHRIGSESFLNPWSWIPSTQCETGNLL